MGYKSTLRSINSSVNKSISESNKEQKRLHRKQERIKRKITNLEDKKTKIIGSLKDLLAKGKINNEEYNNLLKRESNITFDFLIFGKTAATSAAKRYICGKINEEEFKELCESIIPNDVLEEKKLISNSYNKLLQEINNFINSCKEQKDQCYKCSKKKSFFSPLRSIDEIKLCGKCKKELNNLLNYQGINGKYFYAKSCVIPINNIYKHKLEVNIHEDYF